MNRKHLILSMLLISFSACNQKGKESTLKNLPTQRTEITENENFEKWQNFYQQFDPNFKWSHFETSTIDSLSFMPGSVYPYWHPEFKDYYQPLLIFSPDSSRYLDIDSYLWFVIDLNVSEPEIGYSPDQEINLVNIGDSTVTRIAFRGPSSRVEDAFWLDHEEVVLLENNDLGKPMVTIVALDNKVIEYFQYPDSVTITNRYFQERIEKAIETLPPKYSML
jgi:hypothetical protein